MSLGAAAAENDVTASVRGRRVLRPQSTDVIVCGEEIFNINATVTFGNIDIIASVTARLDIRLSPIVAKSRQNTSSANSSAYLSRDLRIGAYPIALEWAVFKE